MINDDNEQSSKIQDSFRVLAILHRHEYRCLSRNLIKTCENTFSKEWESEPREDADAKSFMDAFFYVFGITRRRISSFVEPV